MHGEIAHSFCQAKVQDVRLTSFVDKDIVWLEIPMDHAVLMSISHGRTHLVEKDDAVAKRHVS